MKTKTSLLLLGFLALAASSFAQLEARTVLEIAPSLDSMSLPSLAELRAEVLTKNVSSSSSVTVPSEHRAFFCRFDDKLDQKKVPLRMRLGTLEEVNRMEAKPGYRAGQIPQ